MTYYTRTEIAEILRCTNDTVNRYIKEGQLVATKPMGKILVSKDDLEAFIEAGRIVSGPMGSPGRLVRG
jgi:excisionase family DNA binding protein